jgi:predicted GIY-YIG superfamily endonuclease
MSIADYKKLVETEFPNYTRKLDESSRIPLLQFGNKGLGVKSLIRELNLQKDFKGCYVMYEKNEPVYVGISKCVIKRLKQHVCGNSQSQATLAYSIARKEFEKEFEKEFPDKLTRNNAMKISGFIDLFNSAKERIGQMNVVFVEIEHPLALYIFEPYCAMKYKTVEWNTFETH